MGIQWKYGFFILWQKNNKIFHDIVIVRPLFFILSFFFVLGLTMQADILAYMFNIVESGKIVLPLNPAEQADGTTNTVYIQHFVAHLLKSAFSHLSE